MHKCPYCDEDCDCAAGEVNENEFEGQLVDVCVHDCDDDPDCGFIMDDFGDFGDQ